VAAPMCNHSASHAFVTAVCRFTTDAIAIFFALPLGSFGKSLESIFNALSAPAIRLSASCSLWLPAMPPCCFPAPYAQEALVPPRSTPEIPPIRSPIPSSRPSTFPPLWFPRSALHALASPRSSGRCFALASHPSHQFLPTPVIVAGHAFRARDLVPGSQAGNDFPSKHRREPATRNARTPHRGFSKRSLDPARRDRSLPKDPHGPSRGKSLPHPRPALFSAPPCAT